MSFNNSKITEILKLLEEKHKMGIGNRKYDNLRKKLELESKNKNSIKQITNILLEIMKIAFESVEKHCNVNSHIIGKLRNLEINCKSKKGKSSAELYNACYDFLKEFGSNNFKELKNKNEYHNNAEKMLEKIVENKVENVKKRKADLKNKVIDIDINLNSSYINDIPNNKLNEVERYLKPIRALKTTMGKEKFDRKKEELKNLILQILKGIVHNNYKIGKKNIENIIKLVGNKKINIPLKESEGELVKLIVNYTRTLNNKNNKNNKEFLQDYTEKMRVRDTIDLRRLLRFIQKHNKNRNPAVWKPMLFSTCDLICESKNYNNLKRTGRDCVCNNPNLKKMTRNAGIYHQHTLKKNVERHNKQRRYYQQKINRSKKRDVKRKEIFNKYRKPGRDRIKKKAREMKGKEFLSKIGDIFM